MFSRLVQIRAPCLRASGSTRVFLPRTFASMAVHCPASSMEILQPDDFHHHLRDEPVLEHTVAHASRAFARLLVMPNLVPPVTSTALALEYRERIMKRVPEDVPPGAF